MTYSVMSICEDSTSTSRTTLNSLKHSETSKIEIGDFQYMTTTTTTDTTDTTNTTKTANNNNSNNNNSSNNNNHDDNNDNDNNNNNHDDNNDNNNNNKVQTNTGTPFSLYLPFCFYP